MRSAGACFSQGACSIKYFEEGCQQKIARICLVLTVALSMILCRCQGNPDHQIMKVIQCLKFKLHHLKDTLVVC